MRLEYVVLGVLLIGMGATQTWLRHGPWAKAEKEEQERAGRLEDDADRGGLRSGRRWEAWTAILGGVGILLGLILVVMGLTGS